jgi:hypothetical protein
VFSLALYLALYIEYWGMDTADYKIGMLKKQQLYQQQGKRLISLVPGQTRLAGSFVPSGLPSATNGSQPTSTNESELAG